MEKNKQEFWDRYELHLRVAEENISFNGWEAALMTEFMLHRAAMTRDGALDYVLAGGRYSITPVEVFDFIDLGSKTGLLKYHYEVRKTGKRMRVYKSSLKPDQIEYQLTGRDPQ